MSDDLLKELRWYNSNSDASNKMHKAADRIEKLERDVLKYSSAVADAQMRNEELDRALNRIIDRWETQKARIEKLEATLRLMLDNDRNLHKSLEELFAEFCIKARKALEGKND